MGYGAQQGARVCVPESGISVAGFVFEAVPVAADRQNPCGMGIPFHPADWGVMIQRLANRRECRCLPALRFAHAPIVPDGAAIKGDQLGPIAAPGDQSAAAIRAGRSRGRPAARPAGSGAQRLERACSRNQTTLRAQEQPRTSWEAFLAGLQTIPPPPRQVAKSSLVAGLAPAEV